MIDTAPVKIFENVIAADDENIVYYGSPDKTGGLFCQTIGQLLRDEVFSP